jgi:DNA end-binding protein Ku
MNVPQEPVSEVLRRLTSVAGGGRGDHANGLTKQELYQRAKELDIPRRSAMTKDELARAIARREG